MHLSRALVIIRFTSIRVIIKSLCRQVCPSGLMGGCIAALSRKSLSLNLRVTYCSIIKPSTPPSTKDGATLFGTVFGTVEEGADKTSTLGYSETSST